MNKALCVGLLSFSPLLFLGSPMVKAVDFPEHYRTLNVNVEYTKESKNFTVKNVFPFHLPDDLPGVPVFKGAKGQFSTKTQAHFDPVTKKEITTSETLFGVEVATSSCPKPGMSILSMDSAFGVGNHHGLVGNIVKQTQGNRTQVSNVDFMNSYDTSMDMGKKGCGVVYFDGTDFQGKPYTMKVDLQLKYTFQPISVGLDGEFIISSDNQRHPALNAYVVVPVTRGEGQGKGVIRPGTIIAVGGDISTAATYAKTKGDWFVRYIIAVYKKDSCQIAFKNHSPKKFFWNSKTGTANTPNPSSVLWPTATIISDFTVSGKDRESIMRQVNGNKNIPIHVEDGDCVVQAALPYGNSTTAPGSNMNMESQSHVVYIPD